jgi:hypothetical protein
MSSKGLASVLTTLVLLYVFLAACVDPLKRIEINGVADHSSRRAGRMPASVNKSGGRAGVGQRGDKEKVAANTAADC